MKLRQCLRCGGPSLDSSVCEDCDKEERQSRRTRKPQPKDPTVYVPDYNGIHAFEENQ